MIEKITKSALNYFLADPVRFLGFLVLFLFVTVMLLIYKAWRKENEETIQGFINSSKRADKLEAKLEVAIAEFKAITNNFNSTLLTMSYEISKTHKDFSESRIEMNKAMLEYRPQVEKFHQAVGKLLSIHKKLEETSGRIYQIGDQQDSLVKMIKDAKGKK